MRQQNRDPNDWPTYRCLNPKCEREFKAPYFRRFCGRACFIENQSTSRRLCNVPERQKVDLDEATGGKCRALPTPCQRSECRHHLERPVPGVNGQGDIDPGCSLHAIQLRGDFTLDQIAHTLGLSRERVRQVQYLALVKLRTRENKKAAA